MRDTSPEAAAFQLDLWRKMPPHQKAQQLSQLTRAANRFALAGLRDRYPGAAESELLLRLAVLRLGEELVRKAYGWPRAADGT